AVAAITAAAAATGAQVAEFHLAPSISHTASYHEWFVEFGTPPGNLPDFARLVDENLRSKNVYYNDLRNGNILLPAVIRPLQTNAAREYMRSIGKLGGQIKFPQLANHRTVA